MADIVIREARPEEYAALGRLMVSAYLALDGFPDDTEQPRYYEMLANIGAFGERPDTKLFVALVGERLAGGVVYFLDMAGYGAGGTASREVDSAAFRLLAAAPDARGLGVGKALAMHCIACAKQARRHQLIIHTTAAQTIAWGMYERLGFRRSPDLDFMQEALQVFGFRLALGSTR